MRWGKKGESRQMKTWSTLCWHPHCLRVCSWGLGEVCSLTPTPLASHFSPPPFFFKTTTATLFSLTCALLYSVWPTHVHTEEYVSCNRWLISHDRGKRQKKKMKTNFCILYCLTKLQLPIGSMTVLLSISPEPWGKYIAQLQPKALTMVNNEAIYTTTRGSPAASSARAEHTPQHLRPPSGPDLNHKSDIIMIALNALSVCHTFRQQTSTV